MSFWFNKRESGSPYEDADRLFNEAVTFSHEPARTLEAERSLAAAIAAYRVLVKQTTGFEARRRLAKALWRQASVTALVNGQPGSALPYGKEAVELGREILRTVDASHAAFDSIVQEVSGAMNDVGEICHVAGKSRDREHLLIEAGEVARRSPGLGGRQALGTALHNLAQHRLYNLSASAPGHWPAADTIRCLNCAERALELRYGLCDEPQSEPYHKWELRIRRYSSVNCCTHSGVERPRRTCSSWGWLT